MTAHPLLEPAAPDGPRATDVLQGNLCNIGTVVSRAAERWPHVRAVVFPAGRDAAGRVTYSHFTFQQLDRETDRLARGLHRLGVRPGTRLVLMVRPGLEFIALVFALFKAGAVVVLIDPGMGGRGVLRCLDQVEPEGFVAVPAVHWIRWLSGRRFRSSRLNITVGRGGAGRSPSYRTLLGEEWTPFSAAPTSARDPAAVIFTSGSTGPAKGVLYEHGMFAAQVRQIQAHYGISAGEVDLPGFPLFALFNTAWGVTTVVPDLNPTRPARVNPQRIVEAVANQGVTQAFGSPAIWNRVGRYCEERGITLGSVQRILSAGAPVPPAVLRRTRAMLSGRTAEIFTPYGATEALPVCSISATEVLGETAAATARGRGTCVGHPLPGIEVRVIALTDDPLASFADARPLPTGVIGEITVKGPVVTREYFRQPEATRRAKIPDGESFWHRMGDTGYFDEQGRLWFCGRKGHTVWTKTGPLFTECCEPVFNEHSDVYRTALVGLGPRGDQTPVLIVELDTDAPAMLRRGTAWAELCRSLRDRGLAAEPTRDIRHFLLHRGFPVDVRHNIKINREQLAVWAARQRPLMV